MMNYFLYQIQPALIHRQLAMFASNMKLNTELIWSAQHRDSMAGAPDVVSSISLEPKPELWLATD